MKNQAAVNGLRVLPTQHTVADVLRRVQSLAHARGLTVFAQIDFSGDAERSGWVAYNEPEYLQARHGFPTELTTNIAALGNLAQAAAAADT